MPVNYPRSMIHISFVIFYEHPFCHCCAPACLSNWDIWPGNSVLTWESENKSNSHLPGHHVPYLYYLLLYLPRRDRDRRMEVEQYEWSFGVSANLFINQLGAYSVRVSLIEGKERFVPSFLRSSSSELITIHRSTKKCVRSVSLTYPWSVSSSSSVLTYLLSSSCELRAIICYDGWESLSPPPPWLKTLSCIFN